LPSQSNRCANPVRISTIAACADYFPVPPPLPAPSPRRS
jgi:hypothetical protein